MNKPKRQHYIPEMLLKHFRDSSGNLWVGDRQEGDVWKCKPYRAFKIKDLYTKMSTSSDTDKPTQKSYEYEEALSKIESEAAPIVERVITQVRRKEVPALSPEDEVTLKRFIIAMARRTPEAQKRLASTKDFEDIYYEVVQELAAKNGFPLPDKDTLYSDVRIVRERKFTQHNVDARYAAGDDVRMRETINKFCAETGLMFLLICMPNRGFVIGSHGISIFECGNNESQGCLPLAHDVCVLATPFPDKTTLGILDRRGDQLLKKINTATAQSQQFAGGSEALIHSLMQPKN